MHCSLQVCHAELHVATCFQAVSSRVQVQVIAAQNLPTYSSPLSQGEERVQGGGQ